MFHRGCVNQDSFQDPGEGGGPADTTKGGSGGPPPGEGVLGDPKIGVQKMNVFPKFSRLRRGLGWGGVSGDPPNDLKKKPGATFISHVYLCVFSRLWGGLAGPNLL